MAPQRRGAVSVMRTAKLKDMVKGWFVGDFEPSLLRTKAFEVGVKTYKQGDREAWHYHAIVSEITVVVSGEVEMAGQTYGPGDIIELAPGEGTAFLAKTDATCVVVKTPSAGNDKRFDGAPT